MYPTETITQWPAHEDATIYKTTTEKILNFLINHRREIKDVNKSKYKISKLVSLMVIGYQKMWYMIIVRFVKKITLVNLVGT